jgi:hypothetical protein
MIAAALLAGAAISLPVTSAMAQGYPRITGSGENMSVDYGPMGQGTLVGGGRVAVTMQSGMDITVMHLDAIFVQQPREGYVPLTIGSGENSMTVYVPATMLNMVRDARGNMTTVR